MYRGKDAVYKFFEDIFEEDKQIDEYMREFHKTKMVMNKNDWSHYNQAKTCYVCCESFTRDNYKLKDHCHVSGKFRGAACNRCNLQLRLTHTIPVIFHNLRGYDSHLLLQELGRFEREINVIPNNMEKYMSFSVGTVKQCWDFKSKSYVDKLRYDLRFIDSFQFMSSSLNELVENLKQGGIDKFKYTTQKFNEFTELLTRKGVYPYSFMNKWSKFDVSTNKLEKKHFKNDLTGDEISDDDFRFFKQVCREMKIKTLGEYHDLYLKSDVLLLADVFENFRKTCLDYYKLDPCHYYTAPGLSWDACLKMTEIKLELIPDIDMYLFIEKGLRGGLSVITHRKSTANNKFMKNYDSEKPSKHIVYLDAVNLYGWAMIQNLPYEGFH